MIALRLFALIVFAVAIGGCATGEKVRGGLQPGMTMAQVHNLLGKPDGYRKYGNVETLQYTNRLISGWAWDRTDYAVILTDGLVTEYGNGEIRQGNNGSFFIYYWH